MPTKSSCDVCDAPIDTDPEAGETKRVTFTNYASKSSAKYLLCHDHFTRLMKAVLGNDSVGQEQHLPPPNWKRWPEQD